MTRTPRCTASRTKLPPMKPAPPVTSQVGTQELPVLEGAQARDENLRAAPTLWGAVGRYAGDQDGRKPAAAHERRTRHFHHLLGNLETRARCRRLHRRQA